MRHVVGQMSVAVISRALIVGFDVAGLDPDIAYIVALWGPVLGAVAVIELPTLVSSLKSIVNVGGIFREASSMVVRLRTRPVVDSVARTGR
jgi:hypothetical protein